MRRAMFDTLRSLAYGSIGSSYAAIGAILDEPPRVIHVFNGTNQDILFSDDGTNDKFILPAGGFLLVDVSTNRDYREDVLLLKEHGYWYAKHTGSAPTSGSVYVAIVY